MDYYGNNDYRDYLAHHGRMKQKWGVRNGPPYPLDSSQLSPAEKRVDKSTSYSVSNVKSSPKQFRYPEANDRIGTEKQRDAAEQIRAASYKDDRDKANYRAQRDVQNLEPVKEAYKSLDKARAKFKKDAAVAHEYYNKTYGEKQRLIESGARGAYRKKDSKWSESYKSEDDFVKAVKAGKVQRSSDLGFEAYCKEVGADYRKERYMYNKALGEYRDEQRKAVDELLGMYGRKSINGFVNTSKERTLKKVANNALESMTMDEIRNVKR